jgi:lipopolysaccharide exporter
MVLTQVTSLIRSIILARLLSPDDYGLYSMSLTLLVAVNALTSMGLDQSFIAGKTEEEKSSVYLDTIWSVDLCRRVGISLVLLVLAYPMSLFYGDKRLLNVFLVISITPLLQGLQNIGLVLYRKGVNFSRIAAFEQACNLFGTAIAILLAFLTRNVWAYVGTYLLNAAASTLFSYIAHPYRPKFRIDKAALGQAMKFGRPMFAVSFLTYITLTADNITVGKFGGTKALGAYAVAFSLANLPVQIMSGVLSPVLFAAYAELKDQDTERLSAGFVRSFSVALSMLILLSLPLFLLSSELVRLLYGHKWLAAGPILHVLVLMAVARGLSQPLGSLIMGLNRPEMEARAKAVEAALFVTLLCLTVPKYGALGAAWSVTAVYVLAFIVRARIVAILIPQSIRRFLKALSAGAVAAVCGALAGTHLFSYAAPDFARVLGVSITSCCVALALLLAMRSDLRSEVGRLVAGVRSS